MDSRQVWRHAFDHSVFSQGFIVLLCILVGLGQELPDHGSGYSYVYKKVVRLIKGKPARNRIALKRFRRRRLNARNYLDRPLQQIFAFFVSDVLEHMA